MTPRSIAGTVCVVSLFVFAGCLAASADTERDEASASRSALHASSGLAFSELPAPASSRERRLLITNAAQYRSSFNQAPPAGVDFHNGDALVYYSAGQRHTGGFRASIESLVRSGSRLNVTTRLESPGRGCPVTQAITHPSVMVRFKRPAPALRARFTADDATVDCAPRGCDDGATCEPGQRCELQEVTCVRAPCDPVPVCVDVPPIPTCGGFLGTPCPGTGTCADDPSDDCDPDNGGADCTGICQCDVVSPCPAGMTFNVTPEACDCEPSPLLPSPCVTALCRAGTVCKVESGEPTCVPEFEPAPEVCGDTICAPGLVCCNASCGICTPPDRVCIQLACNTPDDAT